MILIVGNDREALDRLRLLLYRNGLPTGAASIPTFHYHMAKGIYDFVVLLGGEGGGIFLRHFFRRLHRIYPGVPSILVGTPSKTQTEQFSLPDLVISGSYTPVSLIKDIDRVARRLGTRNPIAIRCATVLHDIKNACFTSFHAHFKPPAAETAILHVLMDRYPHEISDKTLLLLSAKPGKKPSPSSLLPNVSRINRRTLESIGKRVIRSQAGLFRFCPEKE